jgi:hypothetical protein
MKRSPTASWAGEAVPVPQEGRGALINGSALSGHSRGVLPRAK